MARKAADNHELMRIHLVGNFPDFVDRQCQVESELGGSAKSWQRFRLWPAQKQLAIDFQEHRLVVALKARQLGFSWMAVSFALWHVLLHPIATVLLFSKRDDEATELVRRLRGMHQRLPPWLREKLTVDNSQEMEWANGSRVMAFPTTAGDSYTGTLAIVDEADLVPDLDRLMASVKPTIDAGGKMLLISRSDKSKEVSSSPFKRVFLAAKQGENGWFPTFLPWNARPDRTPQWYADQQREILSRTGSLDECFEQYPETIEQALAPRSLDKRFPPVWLQKCYQQQKPLNWGMVG